MQIKCKMIGCSNEQSRGIEELGQVGDLHLDKVFYFNTIRSSTVKKIEFKEKMIIINTLNTEYTFIEEFESVQ